MAKMMATENADMPEDLPEATINKIKIPARLNLIKNHTVELN